MTLARVTLSPGTLRLLLVPDAPRRRRRRVVRAPLHPVAAMVAFLDARARRGR